MVTYTWTSTEGLPRVKNLRRPTGLSLSSPVLLFDIGCWIGRSFLLFFLKRYCTHDGGMNRKTPERGDGVILKTLGIGGWRPSSFPSPVIYLNLFHDLSPQYCSFSFTFFFLLAPRKSIRLRAEPLPSFYPRFTARAYTRLYFYSFNRWLSLCLRVGESVRIVSLPMCTCVLVCQLLPSL